MKKLYIGRGQKKDFYLSLDTVTQTIAVLAKKGSGKSYCASVMAEEMLKAGQQIVVIDPTSAWWGLQEKFPIVIFGGPKGNLPLHATAGVEIATAITENGFSAILDLSSLGKGESMRFMIDFAMTIYKLNKTPVHMFVDEADEFAPQTRNWGGDENRMLGAMEDIVRRGRKKGIGITMITQRPSVLNKNVLTQCDALCCLRMNHPRDINAIMEWVNVHADEKQAKTMTESLPSLPVGTAWFWSPGWEVFDRVSVRKRETFDSGATPKADEVVREPKKLKPIDINALGERIKVAAEKARANDPKELRKLLVEKDARIKELESKPAKQIIAAPQYPDLREKVKELQDYIARAPKVEATFETLKAVCDYFSQRPTFEKIGRVATKSVRGVLARTSDVGRNTMKTTPIYDTVIGSGECSIEKPMPRNMLTALAQHRDGLTKRQILIHTGYRASGPVSKAFAEIIRNGWAMIDSRGVLMITEPGIKALGEYTPLPVGDDLREKLINGLHGGLSIMERKLLQVVCESGGPIAKNDILSQAGYAASGPVSKAFGRLVGLGYVNAEGRGHLRAAEQLFS